MDCKVFAKGGSDYISSKILEAINNETRTATISGNWEIDCAIRIPSNFTIILDNCHLRLADCCYSNIFVNQNNDTDIGRTQDGTDTNINIIGHGKAILDGGKYNGLSEKTQFTEGRPAIWKNNLILFTNVDGFKISGISCFNQRWWAINLVFCANGYVGNIDFCANDTGVDAEGNEYHGLKLASYGEALVKNADGVDVRMGCHDILVENITGFTEDDTVACTGMPGELEQAFFVNGLCQDIHHITIQNIRSAAYCSCVRLLNQGGTKLHDILIDGVFDMGPESPHMDRGYLAIRIGDTHLYSTRFQTAEETYNIAVKNVRGGGVYAVSLAGEIKNFSMYGIETFNGAKMLLDEREKNTR